MKINKVRAEEKREDLIYLAEAEVENDDGAVMYPAMRMCDEGAECVVADRSTFDGGNQTIVETYVTIDLAEQSKYYDVFKVLYGVLSGMYVMNEG